MKISSKDRHNKGQKWYGPNKKQKILRKGGKNIQNNYMKKILMTWIVNDGVVTHLEQDILESSRP